MKRYKYSMFSGISDPMNSTHNRYISLFRTFADALLEDHIHTPGMLDITKALSQKASELVLKAVYTPDIDVIKLQKELYYMEQEYLQLISSQHNNNY